MIELKKVSRIYQMAGEKIAALADIDLKIEEGEFMAVVGPSGSGKTTLLNIIGGLDRPTQGAIFINGQDINQLNDEAKSHFRNKTIGFVFQSFNLQPFYTALENTIVPLLWSEVPPKKRRQRAEEALKNVGLTDRMNFYPTQLSSGQRQRVSIARAIINQPKIILADEPTGNLDTKIGNEIVQLLKQLNKVLGTTVIIITHNPTVASQCARVVKLQDGRII